MRFSLFGYGNIDLALCILFFLKKINDFVGNVDLKGI